MSGKVIYVGSIPYDVSEEQILGIFKSVGPVANLRLVFDKDTGKSKGFGFVEYMDAETAASAIRNLQGYPLKGRNLRVDTSHEMSINSMGSSNNNMNRDSALPNLPQGVWPPAGISAPDAVAKIVASFTKDKGLQTITDFKSMINCNQSLAVELLKACPQMSLALVHCLMALGLVGPQQLQSFSDASVLENPSAMSFGNPVAPIVNSQSQIPMAASLPAPPRPFHQLTASTLYGPSVISSVPSLHNAPSPSSNLAATVSHGPAAGNPTSNSVSSSVADVDPDVLRQILQLSDAQIQALRPEEQAAILQLKQSVLAGQIAL